MLKRTMLTIGLIAGVACVAPLDASAGCRGYGCGNNQPQFYGNLNLNWNSGGGGGGRPVYQQPVYQPTCRMITPFTDYFYPNGQLKRRVWGDSYVSCQ